MSKHTPEPWNVGASPTPAGYDRVENEDGLTLAWVFGLRRQKANAALIAAAPSMLKALEQARKALEYCQIPLSREHALVVGREIRKIDNAITKATGKESGQ